MGIIQIAKAQAWENLRKIAPLELALYATLVVLYLVLRISHMSAIQEVKVVIDSASYTNMASTPVWSSALWAHVPFPPTVPLIYKLLGESPYLIAYFQSALSILSWSLLAVCVAREMRAWWLRIVSFAAILTISLSSDVIIWDWNILSESLSLSLLALFFANWLWLVREWKWYKAIPIAIIGFFWMFARDSDAWLILMIAILLALVGVTWRAQRRYLILAAIFVMFFIAYNVSLNESQRWVQATCNVISLRILPDSDRTAFFAEHGMPITPALMARSGIPQGVCADNRAPEYNYTWKETLAISDPELQEFRDWLVKHGKSTYMQFLLSRPLWTATEPFQHQNREEQLKLYPESFAPAGFSHILPSSENNVKNITPTQEDSSVPVAQIVYPKKLVFFSVPFDSWIEGIPISRSLLGWGILSLALVIALLGAWKVYIDRQGGNPKLLGGRIRTMLAVAGTALKQRNATWVIPVAMILLAYPHEMIVFHGDTGDLGRHAVQAVVQWVVGFWMLLLFAIDIITEGVTKRIRGR